MRANGVKVGTPYYPWPCEGCTERHHGCHSNCERYLSAKAEHAAIKAQRNAENGYGYSFLQDNTKIKNNGGQNK